MELILYFKFVLEVPASQVIWIQEITDVGNYISIDPTKTQIIPGNTLGTYVSNDIQL